MWSHSQQWPSLSLPELRSIVTCRPLTSVLFGWNKRRLCCPVWKLEGPGSGSDNDHREKIHQPLGMLLLNLSEGDSVLNSRIMLSNTPNAGGLLVWVLTSNRVLLNFLVLHFVKKKKFKNKHDYIFLVAHVCTERVGDLNNRWLNNLVYNKNQMILLVWLTLID